MGQETSGCPLYSHPAHLADNRDCVLCMICLKVPRVFGLLPGMYVWNLAQPLFLRDVGAFEPLSETRTVHQ